MGNFVAAMKKKPKASANLIRRETKFGGFSPMNANQDSVKQLNIDVIKEELSEEEQNLSQDDSSSDEPDFDTKYGLKKSYYRPESMVIDYDDIKL